MLNDINFGSSGGGSTFVGKEQEKMNNSQRVAKGLEDRHFDAAMDDLGKTLIELKGPNELIAEAAVIAFSVKKEVLNL